MILSPEAALSVLTPINLEYHNTVIGSPESLRSVDIQSDDENDREVVEKRLSRYHLTTPVSVDAIIRAQFSCPDFAMGTARGFKGRIKDAPPVPPIHIDRPESSILLQTEGEISTISIQRGRVGPKNGFVQPNSVKRGWEDTFGEEKISPKKRHGLFLGRLQA